MQVQTFLLEQHAKELETVNSVLVKFADRGSSVLSWRQMEKLLETLGASSPDKCLEDLFPDEERDHRLPLRYVADILDWQMQAYILVQACAGPKSSTPK